MWGFLSYNLAIDLGTANSLIYVPKHGVVLNEPSVIALVNYGNTMVPYAFGHEAKMMLGKTPAGIKAIRPLKDGVIADFKAAEEMIKHFIYKVHKRRFFLKRPLVVVCVPYGSTPVERRAIQEAVECAGGGNVFLIEEPMAAAIGAGLPVTEPTGSMIVDIGGGTTEVGVVSLGGVVLAKSVRVGGDSIDESIVTYIRKHHGLLIGESMAEKIKKDIGAACVIDDENMKMSVRGRNLSNGIPREITVSTKEITESLVDPVKHIVNTVKLVLELTPPELSADIVDKGIFLSGGGALLRGIDLAIKEATQLQVSIAESPLDCVVLGVGKVVENFSALRHVLFKQD